MQAVAYYNPAVDAPIGEALRKIQGNLKNTDIARRALGDAASADDIRDFANYYSRITKDKVPNVGLGRLRQIAKGLGFTKMSLFFARIEGVISAIPSVNDQPAAEVAADEEALPPFESEERISQRVLQLLLKRALDASPSERAADHRLPATARPLAAERNTYARQPRQRNVPKKKKGRRD